MLKSSTIQVHEGQSTLVTLKINSYGTPQVWDGVDSMSFVVKADPSDADPAPWYTTADGSITIVADGVLAIQFDGADLPAPGAKYFKLLGYRGVLHGSEVIAQGTLRINT